MQIIVCKLQFQRTFPWGDTESSLQDGAPLSNPYRQGLWRLWIKTPDEYRLPTNQRWIDHWWHMCLMLDNPSHRSLQLR